MFEVLLGDILLDFLVFISSTCFCSAEFWIVSFVNFFSAFSQNCVFFVVCSSSILHSSSSSFSYRTSAAISWLQLDSIIGTDYMCFSFYIYKIQSPLQWIAS